MAERFEFKDRRRAVELILERVGEIAKELWSWDETNPVFFDNTDIFLEDAYEAAYVEIMKVIIENQVEPDKFGMAFMGKDEGEA